MSKKNEGANLYRKFNMMRREASRKTEKKIAEHVYGENSKEDDKTKAYMNVLCAIYDEGSGKIPLDQATEKVRGGFKSPKRKLSIIWEIDSAGLLSVMPNKKDKRKFVVCLTSEGENIIEEYYYANSLTIKKIFK